MSKTNQKSTRQPVKDQKQRKQKAYRRQRIKEETRRLEQQHHVDYTDRLIREFMEFMSEEENDYFYS